MKKILLMICIFIFTTGCTNINKLNYKDIIDTTIKENTDNNLYNRYSNGYKYYLPKYMNIKENFNYNEKINSNDNTYYLYIDIISYYNKKANKYIETKDYINYTFDNGYLKVKEKDNKYLVEITYNYAKIEVIVDKMNLNEAINNSIIILSTIKYDDKIIENLIVEDKLNGEAEKLNIFEDIEKKDDFMDVIEEYDVYEEDIPDYDKIN